MRSKRAFCSLFEFVWARPTPDAADGNIPTMIWSLEHFRLFRSICSLVTFSDYVYCLFYSMFAFEYGLFNPKKW